MLMVVMMISILMTIIQYNYIAILHLGFLNCILLGCVVHGDCYGDDYGGDSVDGDNDNIDIDDNVDIDDRTLAFLIAFCWAALSAPSSLPPTTMSIMQPFSTCWRESELLQNKNFLRNVK